MVGFRVGKARGNRLARHHIVAGGPAQPRGYCYRMGLLKLGLLAMAVALVLALAALWV